MKILVVDDSPVMMDTVLRHIKEITDTDEVLLCPESVKAYDMIREKNIDILLVDIDAGMSGLEVLAKTRQDHAMDDVYVMVMTSRPGHFMECFAQGADDVIRKPLDPVDLQCRVKAGLKARRNILAAQGMSQELYMNNIKNIIHTAKNNSMMYAAIGIKAFEMAATALDKPSGMKTSKKQMMMASELLTTLVKLDFEEYHRQKIGVFCGNLIKVIQSGGSVESVDTDQSPVLNETVKTRHSLLSLFVITAIRALTDFPGRFYIKLKPNVTVKEKTRRFELSIVITDHTTHDVMQAKEKRDDQVAYIAMLNSFATTVLSLLGGDFQGVMVNDIVILKLMVIDHSDEDAEDAGACAKM